MSDESRVPSSHETGYSDIRASVILDGTNGKIDRLENDNLTGRRYHLEGIGNIFRMAVYDSLVILFEEIDQPRLHVYTDEFEYRGTAGKGGVGPGEFMAIFGFTFDGDSLMVVDPILRRLNVFDNSFQFARSIPIKSGEVPYNFFDFFRKDDLFLVAGYSSVSFAALQNGASAHALKLVDFDAEVIHARGILYPPFLTYAYRERTSLSGLQSKSRLHRDRHGSAWFYFETLPLLYQLNEHLEIERISIIRPPFYEEPWHAPEHIIANREDWNEWRRTFTSMTNVFVTESHMIVCYERWDDTGELAAEYISIVDGSAGEIIRNFELSPQLAVKYVTYEGDIYFAELADESTFVVIDHLSNLLRL